MPKSPSPILIFLMFAGLLMASLLTAAVLSPMAFHLVEKFPIHRVFNRIAMAAFLLGAVLLLRRLSITNRQTLGYAVSRPVFLKSAAWGFAIGVALLVMVAGVMFALGIRRWSAGSGNAFVDVLAVLPGAMLSGIVVAFIEETFFRGAMYGAVRRRGTFAMAVVLTSVLYASVHFLGERFRIPDDQVDWHSGWVLLGNFFNAYRSPLALLDGLVALTLVGALLAIVRERMGHIGAAIGLHAGFVVVILVTRKTSEQIHDHPLAWLVGHRDGIVGWLVAIATLLVLPVASKWLEPASSTRRLQNDGSRETSGA
jgi:membrane protease YdiL (CAAX protease family)